MNDMGIAFELLGVGMVTVFLILSLVVILGNVIIRFVNRFIPEIKKVATQVSDAAKAEIHPNKMAASVSAVDKFTKGTGRITRIKKI